MYKTSFLREIQCDFTPTLKTFSFARKIVKKKTKNYDKTNQEGLTCRGKFMIIYKIKCVSLREDAKRCFYSIFHRPPLSNVHTMLIFYCLGVGRRRATSKTRRSRARFRQLFPEYFNNRARVRLKFTSRGCKACFLSTTIVLNVCV